MLGSNSDRHRSGSVLISVIEIRICFLLLFDTVIHEAIFLPFCALLPYRTEDQNEKCDGKIPVSDLFLSVFSL